MIEERKAKIIITEAFDRLLAFKDLERSKSIVKF